MDYFSNLPDEVIIHILSFLPTKYAARTSLLSRQFRHQWKICPSLEIDTAHFNHLPHSDIAHLADQTLLRRSAPLHCLCLRLDTLVRRRARLLTSPYISSLLQKAASLGSLRKLTLQLDSKMLLSTLLPLIFSLSSLESLTLGEMMSDTLILCPINLPHLKSLSIHMKHFHDDILIYLIAKLIALEDLNLTGTNNDVKFKSPTVKRLNCVGCRSIIISASSLEFFELKTTVTSEQYPVFHWNIPLLKKAVFRLSLVFPSSAHTVRKMLMAVSYDHLEELHLDIEETKAPRKPFHSLLVSGLDPPTFSSLKHLTLEISFHKYNIEDLVILLQHSPALETLKLVHKPPGWIARNMNKKTLWRSMLPQNAEHAYFENLHILENKEELLRKLTEMNVN